MNSKSASTQKKRGSAKPAITKIIMVIVMILAPVITANAQKIYIVTDLEGASGVYKPEQAWINIGSPLYIQACEYLMGDVNAVVRGLRDGGATEILVLDGHGPQTVIPHLLEPGAKHITGKPKPRTNGSPLWGLDKSFAGIVQIGAHSMRGTPDGNLNHTQSVENRYWYNGVETGEMGQAALVAGYFGVPNIMVSGDEAACREAKKFFGENCVAVPVKQGISREAAVIYPLSDTRKALYEGAKHAMEVIKQCKPYTTQIPIKAKKQFLSPAPEMKEYLEKGPDYWKSNFQTKEGTIQDALHIYDF
jgi:D-amino peptidase